MKISIVSNLINVVGNAFLIYVIKIGVAGAALSTLFSRVVAAVLIWILLKKAPEIPISRDWRIDWGIMRKILYIGVPNGVENSIFQLGKILLGSLIAGFGTAAITANAVAGNVCNFQLIPSNAIGIGMITVIGQCIGAGDVKQAKHYLFKLLKLAYIFTISAGVVLIALSRPICSWYQLSDETTAMTMQLLIYHSICSMLVHPLSFAQSNALRAANDVKYTMVVAIASMWICRIVFAYILALNFHLGVFGVWIAMTMDWGVRSFLFTRRVLTGKWVAHMGKLVDE